MKANNTTLLLTHAEQRAASAEQLDAFSGLNLLHIRKNIKHLLGLIGRNGIFYHYTVHDIAHIDPMLKMLDWLVPERTRKLMTPADWLLIVLAIYFHDLGMLVTNDEFRDRHSSEFPIFCERELFAGADGKDYRARVWRHFPSEEERDRFLYQEFVRSTHAQRVAHWISGRASDHLGISKAVVTEVNSLLVALPAKFRSDLALVCESHHLNDLDDTKKYQISLPYGNSVEETANVQYAALLLRTTDLLHITRDRAPSILFRIISPSDPVSQEEWAKQDAVRSVRAQMGRGADGLPNETAARDTIEIFATFTRIDGFFGLTSYLTYAREQLRKSNEWAEISKRRLGSRYEFPWRVIDDTNIEAQGFLPQPFGFELDQARILDLLTGHTLYNDSDVVLRELIQNSLDAVRLQAVIDGGDNSVSGSSHIDVLWNPSEGILSVQDNGTGMTQSIIEQHLLRVGSSRYQDPEFRKRYPTFSAISRFGIGILSCFMVADDVEIVTVHPEESEARHLSLRTVHGRYLIRLLDKASNEQVKEIGPHGTLVRLRLRPSAHLADVLKTVRKWIIFPEAEVRVKIAEREPVLVGFRSPAEALRFALRALDFKIDETNDESGKLDRLEVIEKQVGNIEIAFGVEWSEYFQDRSFITIGDEIGHLREEGSDNEDSALPLGLCVEGVRVEFRTPGFRNYGIAAICNATGLDAPKTNVARSSIESTPEYEINLKSIYSAFIEHVAGEVRRLEEEHQFSLTWAIDEAEYLLHPLLRRAHGTQVGAVRGDLLLQEIERLPVLLVEREGRREAVSPRDFSSVESFWTLDSALLRSAEVLIKEAAGRTSLTSIIKALNTPFGLPTGPILANSEAVKPITDVLFGEREIDQIVISGRQRRVDLHWTRKDGEPRWREAADDDWREVYGRRSRHLGATELRGFKVGISRISVDGGEQYIGVRSRGGVLLFPGTSIGRYILELFKRLDFRANRLDRSAARYELQVIVARIDSVGEKWSERNLRKQIRKIEPDVQELINLQGLVELSEAGQWRLFDPKAWLRSHESDQDFFEVYAGDNDDDVE